MGILQWPPTVFIVLILPRLTQLMIVKRETPQSLASSVVVRQSFRKLILFLVMVSNMAEIILSLQKNAILLLT
jgi:hypothetical protein